MALADKVVVITGSTRGIGRAIADARASNGANLPHGRRRPPRHRGTNLRELDKPILSSYSPKQHANRDFVTARVAHNRRRARRLLVAFALLMIAGAVGGWWALTRSVTFSVTATPSDARLIVAQSPEGARIPGARTGTLCATDTVPGSYRVVVSRTGFATQSVTVVPRRLRANRIAVTLEALPRRPR